MGLNIKWFYYVWYNGIKVIYIELFLDIRDSEF